MLHQLTPQAFHHAVHSLEPRIAVFDCDGTLWSPDAGSGFMHWTVSQGIVSPQRAAWLAERYDGYRQGAVSELAICGEMVQVFAGLSEATLREAARVFFRDHIEPHLFPDMLTLVEDLHLRGIELWAVSSTCDWVIDEGVQRFGIPRNRVLAAKVRTVDGYATDQLLDVPTDEGKVVSLHRAGITAPDAVFGNSIHDAAMLAIARRAFPVNPSPALLERSAHEGWPVFFPASATL